MPSIVVSDAFDPRLRLYQSLTDSALRKALEAERGVYIAESFPVIERALAAGHIVQSLVVAPRWEERALALAPEDTPVFIADADAMEAIAGFDVHRGALAVFERPEPRSPESVLTGGTVVVIDGVTDATNIGAIFRAAAAFGADGVLLTPTSGDPLYRRSIRVSMGTVFQVPWARTHGWVALQGSLQERGYTIAALALTDDAIALEDYAPESPVALVMGSEGPGLGPAALRAADTIVEIPMDGGVDSLNVGAASAVALFALRAQQRSVTRR